MTLGKLMQSINLDASRYCKVTAEIFLARTLVPLTPSLQTHVR